MPSEEQAKKVFHPSACIEDNSGLDRTYTVFGEVFRGMDVVDKIVSAARDDRDNPLQPITMTMTVKE